MIPLIDDAIWLQRFAGVAPLVPPESPLLVIAPHPDDETLGAGGLIATMRSRHQAVTVVAVTDGENAYDVNTAEREALRGIRQREQEKALSALGVEPDAIHRLRLTDSGLLAQEKNLVDLMMDVAKPGMTMLAPWDGDFHPDHVACARAAAVVAESRGLPLLSYFFWTWHRGSPELLDGLPVRRFDLSPDALSAKARALAMHQSQLERPEGEPILSSRLLAPARWPFEVFLQA